MTADAEGDAEGVWGPRKLLGLLVVTVTVLSLLVAGLVYAVWTAVRPSEQVADGTAVTEREWPVGADGVRGAGYRDAVAARPMLASTRDDLRPAAPALEPAPTIRVGPAGATGAAGVATGFSRTPEGAVGQLAAISVAVLTPASIASARQVHDAWASPGARFGRWELARAIQSLHQSAGTTDGDPTVMLTATPVGAQVKGTDGPDWVLACVQLDVSLSIVEQTRFGYGHCERMQWREDRWVIGPGRPPAPAPSTWPGSDRSLEAGWRVWDEGPTPANERAGGT